MKSGLLKDVCIVNLEYYRTTFSHNNVQKVCVGFVVSMATRQNICQTVTLLVIAVSSLLRGQS